ncbi:hypothetical protein BJY52DRAFT_1399705 [Lactarius psammicola]|nr:hypothetical protein BJY52DRAFT_1399705 [Lactarius psammicola]
MSGAPHETINVRDAGIGDDQYPPQSAPNQASHKMSNFVDGSGPIFSMYLERAEEEDKKMAESWKAHADGALIWSGLFSAAVASLISVSIQDMRPNPQDTSNFYLANIYQTIADPNRSNISNSLPAPPPPFSPPNYAVWVNGLWFLSLGIAIACASLATLIQQWARRYLKVAQTRYSPHKRARIRTFFFEGTEKLFLPWLVEGLPILLHVSLFLFAAGLVVFQYHISLISFKLQLSSIGASMGLYGCLTLMPIFRHDSPYHTPFTLPAWHILTGISYAIYRVLRWFTWSVYFHGSALDRFKGLEQSYRKLLVQGMQKTVEETALNSPSEIDTRAFMWTFDRLDEDHELERFFSGLPGLRSSKVVDDPLPSLTEEGKKKLSEVLIGFLDRTFSSDLLPEPVKIRRAVICAKALDPAEFPNAYDHILFRTVLQDQYRGLQAVEFGRVMRGWGDSGDRDIALVVQAILTGIVAKAQRRNDSWFILASGELGAPETVLRYYAAHGNSLSLSVKKEKPELVIGSPKLSTRSHLRLRVIFDYLHNLMLQSLSNTSNPGDTNDTDGNDGWGDMGSPLADAAIDIDLCIGHTFLSPTILPTIPSPSFRAISDDIFETGVLAPHLVEEPMQIVARSIDEEVQAILERVEEPAPFLPRRLGRPPQPAVEEIQMPVPELVETPPGQISGAFPRTTVEPLRPMSSTRSISSIPPSLPGPSLIAHPELLPTTSILTSVTESTPRTMISCCSASSQVPASPTSIRESLWAPETDDTYESSILRASSSVQSLAFPEGPDNSFDTSFLRPTASAYTSQEPSRLSTIDESQSSESPPITYSSPSSPSLTPTVSMSISASAEPSPSPTGTVSISVSASATPSLSPTAPPTVPSPSLRAPSSTTVSTPILSPQRSQVALTRTPSTVSTASSISMRSDILDNRSLFEEAILEDVSTEPSLLSTHRSIVSRAISPANSSSEDTLIAVDANCFREWHRPRDRVSLSRIIGRLLVSLGGPHGTPDYPYLPLTVKESPRVVSLSPPPHRPRSPSSLSPNRAGLPKGVVFVCLTADIVFSSIIIVNISPGHQAPTLIAPTPMRPQTSLDDMMAELLCPLRPTAAVQIQPPPTFVRTMPPGNADFFTLVAFRSLTNRPTVG